MNPFARIYVEKIRKMIEEADVAFLLSDRIRREALCLVSYLKMQHLFWFYYFTEEENTLLLSCNSTAKPSASLVLLKKNIQLYFLVNFPTANPTEMMKIMQTQHAFELFCPQNIIRKETIKQQSINQSATSTLTMKLTTAAPTVLFSFIVASTMMEPSLSEKILMRENANEVSRRI